MWVMMVQHKTSDQYLTSGKVSTRSIHGFKRNRLLKSLTKNFNILSDVDANTDAMVTCYNSTELKSESEIQTHRFVVWCASKCATQNDSSSCSNLSNLQENA